MRTPSIHRVTSSRPARVAKTLALCAAVASALTLSPRMLAPSDAGDSAGTPTAASVDVGQQSCGAGWSGGSAGRQSFSLDNSSPFVEEIQLQSVDSQRIFLDVEDLGVGARRTVSLTLAAGHYRFLCLGGADGMPFAGPAWSLTGSYAGPTTPGNLPATEQDFLGPVDAYSAWVVSQLGALSSDVTRLRATIVAGRLLQARSAWMRAHRQWLLLGAAYDAFGDVGAAIDSPTTPNVAPISDPSLTGFPKLEAILWNAAPARGGRSRSAVRDRRRRAAQLRRAAGPVAARLVADVGTLATTFNHPVQPTDTDMGLRCHEILEDALRFELTGRDDAGAHLTLFDVDAMVDATRDIMAPLRGLLVARDADLGLTDAWLTRLKTYVDTFHDARTGAWTPLQSLTSAQHRKLEATLSQTLEYLSEIAVDLDPVEAGPA